LNNNLKTNQRSNSYETLLSLPNHNTLHSTIQEHGDINTHKHENLKHIIIIIIIIGTCGSTTARLLGLWVRIPPGAWIYVCCECCALSARGPCDGPIQRSPTEWGVPECDLEIKTTRRPRQTRLSRH